MISLPVTDPTFGPISLTQRHYLITLIVGTLIRCKTWGIGIEARQQVAGSVDPLLLMMSYNLRDSTPKTEILIQVGKQVAKRLGNHPVNIVVFPRSLGNAANVPRLLGYYGRH